MTQTITSANSVLMLAVANVFPTPIQIQGFGVDDGFISDPVDQAETVQGLDGTMSYGFIFMPKELTITIMPNSPSLALFEAWQNVMKANREVSPCSGSISIPAIGRKYVLSNGVLFSAPPIVPVKKTLAPMVFKIRFQEIIGQAA